MGGAEEEEARINVLFTFLGRSLDLNLKPAAKGNNRENHYCNFGLRLSFKLKNYATSAVGTRPTV